MSSLRGRSGIALPGVVLALAGLSLVMAALVPVLQRSARDARLAEGEALVERVRAGIEDHRAARGRWPDAAPPGVMPPGLADHLPPGTTFQGPGLQLELRRWRTVDEPPPPPEIPEVPDDTPADTIALPPPTVRPLAGLSVHASDPAILASLLSLHGPDDSFVRDSVWTLVFPVTAEP